jgi:hypothetical protein
MSRCSTVSAAELGKSSEGDWSMEMRRSLGRAGRSQAGRARKRALVVATALATSVVALAAAVPALATNAFREEFAPFANCPVETAQWCMVATTLSGEFKLDLKTTTIVNPVVLQGGLATDAFADQPLLGPTSGEAVSKTAQPVPGGLTGVSESIGGPVTATAELVGPPSSVIVNKGNLLGQTGTAVTLPIRVKLDNENLGEECFIGTAAEPIVLHLTTGTTAPPFPGQPITGSRGTLEGAGKGKIVKVKGNSLVDNDFAVPGASGCGGSLSPLLDAVVDAGIGIPSPAGTNAAVMTGELEETASVWAAKYKPKVKKPKKEKKPKA